MPRKETPVTAHNPPTPDRTAFLRWLCLFGFAIALMFMGALWLFSLLPGVDATALYAPILTHLWGILIVAIGIGAFVVAWRGIAPAVLAHYHPDRKAERTTLKQLITERDHAKEAALLAERDLQNALGHVEAWQRLIADDYRTLYPTDASTIAPDAMLRTMRTELLIIRPRVERAEEIVRERNDLRTKLAEALNRPLPTPVAWQDLLSIVEYGAQGNITVKGLRDVLRKVAPIPEGEYAAFSDCVRALKGYSPAKRGAKPVEVLTVAGAVSPQPSPVDGRNSPVTDGRIRSRTKSKSRTKLPTAKTRLAAEVQA
jgi:hypothetical protein